MTGLRNLLLGLCLLGAMVLAWDALPFFATANSLPEKVNPTADASLATATFAGGCFWCMEKPFDAVAGVVSTTSGYTGGNQANPTYAEVSAGGTGHVEAVQVLYDPAQVSYDTLLGIFWKNVDPLDSRGQFCDQGSQYQAKIFVHDDQQQQLATASKQQLSSQFEGTPIATSIEPVSAFYPAEAYHQDYYLKHPVRYNFYRKACGRDQRLHQVWGDS
jgi:peptide-methionine (S)-S-oxide reductase